MRRLISFVVVVLAGCATLPTPRPAFPAELNLENRGGPGFVVNLNGTDVAIVGCNVGVSPLAPGTAGVPALPWRMTVYTAAVTRLPQWLVQIGEDIGMGSTAVAGPPGPTCPPSG